MAENNGERLITTSSLEGAPVLRLVQPFLRKDRVQIIKLTNYYPTMADAAKKAGGVGAGWAQYEWVRENPGEAFEIFAQAIEDGAVYFYFLGAAVGDAVPCFGWVDSEFRESWSIRHKNWYECDRIVLVD